MSDSSRRPRNRSPMNSRSSCTVNLEVLMIRSAMARMGASWDRSARMLRSDVRLVAPAAESLSDEFAELVHCELGSVDDQVGHGADGSQLGPLGADAQI